MNSQGISIWQVGKTGLWACEFRYRLPSTKLRKVQRTNFATKREAAATAQRLAVEHATNYQPNRVSDVASLIDAFVDYKMNIIKPHTVASYKQNLDCYVRPYLGRRLVHKLTTADLVELMTHLRQQGKSTSTINTVRSRLSSLLSYAVQMDLVRENVAARSIRFRSTEGERSQVQEPWSLEEAKHCLNVFSKSPLDLFVHLSVTLGLRKGEVLALKWGDVDFEKGEIYVTRSRGERRMLNKDGVIVTRSVEHDPKTKASSRVLGIPPQLLLAFMREKERLASQGRQPTNCEYLALGSKGEPLSQSSLTRIYNRICAENGLRRIRIHDHRHTAIVLSIECGALIEEASQGAGHSSTEVTKRIYAPYVRKLADGFSSAMTRAFPLETELTPAQQGASSGGGVNV